jgi:protein TonB
MRDVMDGKPKGSASSNESATDDLLARYSLSRPWDRGAMQIGFCAAVIIHMLAFLVSFPEEKPPEALPKPKRVAVIRKYIPPPPRPQRPQTARAKIESKRKIPIPDPTPDYPEPISEPEPEFLPAPLPPGVDFMIGAPEPPPGYEYGSAGGTGTGPLLPGVGGVTSPVRIEESYVRPEYPEIARVARVSAEVILQAIIWHDGTVGECKCLRCTQKGYGFEEMAIAAVEQWRYMPATQDGEPVDVYFTIIVDFDIL